MSTTEETRTDRLDVVLAALTGAAAIVVPLVFVTDRLDAFALPKVTVLRFFAVVMLVVIAVRMMRSGFPRLEWILPVDGAVAAFLVLNVAAWALSIDPYQSFFGERFQYQGLLTILLYVGFFYVARFVFGAERRLVWLFAAVAGTGAAVSAYALLQRAGFDPWWEELLRGRVFSSIGQPNALAAYLVVVIPAAAALALRARGTWRLLWWGVVAAGVVAAGLTLSRGGYLGLVAGTAVAGVAVVAAGRLERRRVVVGLVAIAVLVGLLALVPQVRSESAQILDRAASSADVGSFTTRHRLDLWRIGYEIALDHPVVGAGQETFPQLFPEYRDAVLSPYRAQTFFPYRPESPHNVYLATAAGSGLPALAAYVVFVIAALVIVGRARAGMRDEWTPVALAAIVAAGVGHLVTDLFVTAEVTATWLFWVLLGAGLAAARHGAFGSTIDRTGVEAYDS